MVEQEAVNFEVAGSSPVPGAKNKKDDLWVIFFYSLFSWEPDKRRSGRWIKIN